MTFSVIGNGTLKVQGDGYYLCLSDPVIDPVTLLDLVVGNISTKNANPAGSSYSTPHDHNVGDYGLLLVCITMTNTVNFANVTYGGQPMTPVANNNYPGLNQRLGTYVLIDPPTGNNNIVVTMNGNQWNNISIYGRSFLNSGGVGTVANKGGVITPNSQTLAVSEGSVIYATGISNSAQSNPYMFDGVTKAAEFEGHNTNKIVEGALSDVLSAGTVEVITKADSSNVTNFRVEIKAYTTA